MKDCEQSLAFEPWDQYEYSLHSTTEVSYGISWENMFNDQGIMFILKNCMFNLAIPMEGEIMCQSLAVRVKG